MGVIRKTMTEPTSSKFMRIIGLVLGVVFIIFPLFMLLTMGSADLLVAPFLGIMFVIYGLGGNKALLNNKWLRRYGNKLGKTKNV